MISWPRLHCGLGNCPASVQEAAGVLPSMASSSQYPIGHTPASIAPGVSGFGEVIAISKTDLAKVGGPEAYAEGGMCVW